jgi:hypothetical protein
MLGAALWAMAAAAVLAGCASYEPYEYHDDRDEMQGPGLFSGKDGVFTIWGGANQKDSGDAPEAVETEKKEREDGRPDAR